MTLTASPPVAGPPQEKPKRRRAIFAAGVAAALAAGGLGAGLALTLGGTATPTGSPAPSVYSYYQAVMGRFGIGSMMGGSAYGRMMGPSGYSWTMGGANAPSWMRGQSLPGFMMGSGTDPGAVMGQLFADAPGPRVSPSEAIRLGSEVPAGASVDKIANRITFSGQKANLVVLASPSMPDESFYAAGMTNPTLVVPTGATVSIELINADQDMVHGLVVSATGADSSWMPMMSVSPAFDGAALWFLGESTSAGMHAGTFTFTASAPGTYQYLCPVPGHAQKGMVGTFVVEPGS